jgi:hypothetical protein
VNGLPGKFIKRTMVDVNSYLGEVNAKMSETSRSHEYEADSMAVEFLANAGINPKGCIDVIATPHRGSYKPIAAVGDSHPGEVERTKNIQDSMEAKAAAYRRAQAKPVKPGALPYCYDECLEVVAVYPRGSRIDSSMASESQSADSLPGK